MPVTQDAALCRENQNGADEPRRILFVCTGNTCRSPMAAALLNDLSRPRELCSMSAGEDGPRFVATSAGLYATDGAPITPMAAAALAEAGVVATPINDYTAHRARTVTAAMMAAADEVVAMTGMHAMELLLRFPEHAAKIGTLPLDIPDPYGGDAVRYRDCLQLLLHAIHLRWLVRGGEA